MPAPPAPWWRTEDLTAYRDTFRNADATTRAVTALLARQRWMTRAIVDGVAHLISHDGSLELKLFTDAGEHVTHTIDHNGRDRSPAETADWLASL